MATPIFPSFDTSALWLGVPGLFWDVTKTPNWDTGEQITKTGRTGTVIYRARPLWKFHFIFNVFRDQLALARNAAKSAPFGEFQAVLSFCLSRYGRGLPFFITDPSDRRVTAQTIMASTPASTTDFPMVRAVRDGSTAFVEPVGGVNVVDAIVVRIDGTPTSAYTANVPFDGWIRFTSAPGAGHTITADFSYYHKVAFTKDALDFRTALLDRWEARQVDMQTRWP